MAKGEPDFVDMLAFPLFFAGGILATGMITPPPSIEGFSLAAELIRLGPDTVITLPHVAQLLALGIMVGTNKPELDPWTFSWAWITLATVILVVAMPFVPLLATLTGSNVFAAFAILTFQSFGYGVASWMG